MVKLSARRVLLARQRTYDHRPGKKPRRLFPQRRLRTNEEIEERWTRAYLEEHGDEESPGSKVDHDAIIESCDMDDDMLTLGQEEEEENGDGHEGVEETR